MSRPTPVTVLGLGPMGQALAGAFLARGHRTTVWNRTPGKANSLRVKGALPASTVAEAVTASPLVVACVIDYDAVHAIVSSAADALKGRTLVNLTADTPERARQTAAWAADHGIDYLDGAIMTPAPTIGGDAAAVLYSGPEHVHRTHAATLASIGGTSTYLGADPGRAAAFDVSLLDLFWTSMSGLVHAFALARAEGVTARELAPYAKGIGTLVADLADGFAGAVDDGHHPGDVSSITSAAAGVEHVLHASADHGLDTGVLTAALDVARRAILAGHGSDGFSRLAEVLPTERSSRSVPAPSR